VRYDVGPNARRGINPGLHVYPHLWRYARNLYQIPAFRDTTDFAAFTPRRHAAGLVRLGPACPAGDGVAPDLDRGEEQKDGEAASRAWRRRTVKLPSRL